MRTDVVPCHQADLLAIVLDRRHVVRPAGELLCGMVAMEREYPARADSVPVARSDAAGWVRELGGEESVAQAVALAVTEACSNVVVHAYREQDEPGKMTVLVEEPDGVLCVTVLDDGVGIVARLDSPGLGMGLSLISHITDGLEVHSRLEGGSEVNMRFDLTRSRAAA
jgi:serine/threonine-protein kinase RsbW